jgi:hypothetical protein
MIYISQWLCSQRHCSIAVAWDEKDSNEKEVERQGEEIYTSGVLNRRCGLCSGELRVEHRASIFQTIEEAKPWLELFQRNQMITRSAILN